LDLESIKTTILRGTGSLLRGTGSLTKRHRLLKVKGTEA